MVDDADLAQWEGDFGVNGDSDADGNGDSDGFDLLAWQRTYNGPAAQSVTGGGGSGSLTVEDVVRIDDVARELDREEEVREYSPEEVFKMQKEFIEMLFSAKLVDDETGDGLVNRDDLDFLITPLLGHPNMDVPRLLSEVAITPYRPQAIGKVPEPATYGLCFAAIGLLGAYRKAAHASIL